MEPILKTPIAQKKASCAEPLHWAIDKYAENCILLKRGRKSIISVDFDGKNYTVLIDPKERSSMGCQKTSFKDAIEMAQKFLDGTLEGGTVPPCASNIRRWLKHGQDSIEVSESDEWEKASKPVKKAKFDWVCASKPGAAYLRKARRNYIKVIKRIPSEKNSEFYQQWIKECPYRIEWCEVMDATGKRPVGVDAPNFKDAFELVKKLKGEDYSSNGLTVPEMPDEVKEHLRKGRSNPNAESLTEDTKHIFKWVIFDQNHNRVSLVLDGRYETAAVYRNPECSAENPYMFDVYSFSHDCELSGKEKTIVGAVEKIADQLSGCGEAQYRIKVPPMPTRSRLWIDTEFAESTLQEKGQA